MYHGIPPTHYQVFREGEGSYHYSAYPLPPQELQLLYPGRLMSNQWHYTGDNIPNEDPQGLAYTKSHSSALERAAAIEEEALARHLGGKNKVARHPAVEPEAVIEDPDLRYVSIRDSPNPNLDKVPSQIPSMRTIDIAGERLSETSRAESHRAEEVARLGEETGLPDRVIRETEFEYPEGREGFKYPPQNLSRFCRARAPNVHPFAPAEPTHGAHPPEFVTPRHAPPFWRESFNLEKDLKKGGIKLWMWLVGGLVILLVLIIIGVVIYEMVKRRKKR